MVGGFSFICVNEGSCENKEEKEEEEEEEEEEEYLYTWRGNTRTI